MQGALEYILKNKTEEIRSKIQLKEDMQDKMLNENLDSSQAKENFYKEEYLKQLKLLDHSQHIPSDSLQMLNLYYPDTFEHGSGMSINDEDKKKYHDTVKTVNNFLNELITEQKDYNYAERSIA